MLKSHNFTPMTLFYLEHVHVTTIYSQTKVINAKQALYQKVICQNLEPTNQQSVGIR